MFLASILTLVQTETRFNQPTYFLPVVLLMLAAGLVLWLVAAVLGFARARAFGRGTGGSRISYRGRRAGIAEDARPPSSAWGQGRSRRKGWRGSPSSAPTMSLRSEP